MISSINAPRFGAVTYNHDSFKRGDPQWEERLKNEVQLQQDAINYLGEEGIHFQFEMRKAEDLAGNPFHVFSKPGQGAVVHFEDTVIARLVDADGKDLPDVPQQAPYGFQPSKVTFTYGIFHVVNAGLNLLKNKRQQHFKPQFYLD